MMKSFPGRGLSLPAARVCSDGAKNHPPIIPVPEGGFLKGMCEFDRAHTTRFSDGTPARKREGFVGRPSLFFMPGAKADRRRRG